MQRLLHIIKQKIQSISSVTFYFIGLILLHFGFVWNILPMELVSRIGKYPITQGDYPYHYGQVLTNLDIFEKYGQVWGYSADFYAGYLTGITTIASSKVWLFFVYLSKQFGIPVIVSFNIFPILLLVMIPFLFYFSLKRFNLDSMDSILATFFMIIYFWSSNLFILFIKWGMISHVFSFFLVIFCLSQLYNFIDKEKDILFNSILLTLIISLSGWFHPLSSITLLSGSAIILIANNKKVSLCKFILLIFVLLISIIVQIPWLSPLISIRGFPNTSVGNQFAAQQFFTAGGWWNIKNDFYKDSANANLHRLLIFFSIYGLYCLWKRNQKVVCGFFGLFPIIILLFSYGGYFINQLEPMRFKYIAFLILIIPASVGIMYIFRIFLNDKSNYFVRLCALIFLVIMIWPQIYIIRTDHFRNNMLLRVMSPETKLLIKWLEENTNMDGRIFYETSYYEYKDDREKGFLNISNSGYIGLASGREFVNGPMEWDGPLDFINGKISGIPIKNITIAEILRFVEMYNVHWVIVYSDDSKNFLNKYPEHFVKVDSVKYFDMYKIRSPSNYFFVGKGMITKENGGILISKAEGNQIVIKYHWVPFLRSYPQVNIEREIVNNDPYGFIKIINPPQNVKIWVQK